MRLPVRILPRLFAAAMSIVGLVSVAPAGTTGFLNGKVTDIQTGEALPQVNILVTGSGRGGVTNSKGEYSISGITAGVYTVRISLLGYQAMESRKVTINADETAVLNFKLASSDIVRRPAREHRLPVHRAYSDPGLRRRPPAGAGLDGRLRVDGRYPL